jgi:tetratricopeptide (TPR) repeat protein
MAVRHHELGNALLEQGDLDGALEAFERAIAIAPAFAWGYNGAGVALHRKHKFDDAVDAFTTALRIDASYGTAADNLGVLLRELGDLREAKRWFLRAVELEPDNGRFLRHLADHEPIDARNPLVEQLERAASAAHVPADLRIEALFGYAKALSDQGRLEEAFSVLKEANRLRRETIAYDQQPLLQSFDLLVDTFSPAFASAVRNCGHPSRRPIFIVGMPRSGTTLVESLLAAHPDVQAGGELATFELGLAAMPRIQSSSPLSELRDALHALGATYISDTDDIADGVPYLTDKMPFNFRFLPVINAALPNARIVHVRRNPLDVAYSCFATYFVDDLPFAYDLAELGSYYGAYERLMSAWKRIVPPGQILEVQYEELVADVEAQMRRVLHFCGLEWDEVVLRFHKSRHHVKSASQVQVRRPLYATSIGRGEAVRSQLEPFERARAGR